MAVVTLNDAFKKFFSERYDVESYEIGAETLSCVVLHDGCRISYSGHSAEKLFHILIEALESESAVDLPFGEIGLAVRDADSRFVTRVSTQGTKTLMSVSFWLADLVEEEIFVGMLGRIESLAVSILRDVR